MMLVATLAIYPGMASAEQDINLMANTSPPYADPKLPEQGFALELVRRVFAGTGYTPKITIENWSRAVEGAQIGVYDGLAAAWYSEQRDQDLLFSKPYLDSKLVILIRRSDRNDYRQLADLAGGRLGVRADYAYGIDFAAVPGLTLVEENHLVQNLLRLLNGSVDFVVGDLRTVNFTLQEFLADRRGQFAVAGIELPDVQRHVAINRALDGHEDIVAAFNAALARAVKDGSLQAIIDKWDQRYEAID
jgi:polar amino acid transport system substrate-binding protein